LRLWGADESPRLGQEQRRHGELLSQCPRTDFPVQEWWAPHRNNIQLGKYGRNRTNVWNYPSANTFSRSGPEGDLLALHPTPKPVALIADAIKDSAARGALVLDPFLGSGTAVIAAERTGRVCYGMELDPLYVDGVVRRWQRRTKRDAVHVSFAFG
jgi:DNA modification methylase